MQRSTRAFDDDRYRGHTTVGPQRDDIELSLDGRDARRQASQGEQRSLALALRLAGHELVRRRRGVDPFLLLDDVFSELDPHRSDRLLNLLPAGQTLVTTASPLPAALSPAAVIDLTELVPSMSARRTAGDAERPTQHAGRTTSTSRPARHRRHTTAVADHCRTGDRRALSSRVREERRADRECPVGRICAANQRMRRDDNFRGFFVARNACADVTANGARIAVKIQVETGVFGRPFMVRR